ncbi:MAG: hypothetical protein ACYSVY_19065 [Planctomycetota bacterium]|jgi:chromosome segregation ATPase
MAQAGIWVRFGQWFKSVRRSGPGSEGLPPVTRDGLLQQGSARPVGGGDGRPAGPLSRRRQHEQALATLQHGYRQVAELIDSIHTHLKSQDRRTREIARALNRLAETTSRLPEAAEGQEEKLGAIAAQIEASNDRARRWEQTLLDLPKLADAQREALTVVGRQFDTIQESDRQMAATLDGLRTALTSWGESSTAATEALIALQASAATRNQRLDALMTSQSRRFTLLFVMTTVLALAAIGTGIIALLK